MRRLAILLDGGFVCKRLRVRSAGQALTAGTILAECARIARHPDFVGHDLLRVYFYDAPPAIGVVRNPIDGASTDLTRTRTSGEATKLLRKLELSRDVALRQGEVVVRGWRLNAASLRGIGKTGRALTAADLQPDIQQKGVDLRIGLDIARLSLQRLVTTIVFVTGDSDMIPAFKFARREGVRVYLDHLGAPVRRDLKAHVDVVL